MVSPAALASAQASLAGCARRRCAAWKRAVLAAALAGAVVASGPLGAQPAADVLDLAEAARLLRLPSPSVERLAREGRLPGREIDGRWRFSRAALLSWLAGSTSSEAPAALPADALSQTTGRQQPAGARAGTVGEQPAAPSAEAIALRDQGGVLRRGSGSVELGLSHSRNEDSLAGVVRIESSATTASGVLRFVPIDGLQVSARLPYTWQTTTRFADTNAVAGPAEATTRADGRGDATLSLLGQLVRERSGLPNVLVGLDGVLSSSKERSDGAGATMLLTKSADPAVLFASLSYVRALDKDKVNERTGLARNNVGVNLGYTYALNDLLALNGLFSAVYRSYRTEAPGALAGSLPPSRESYALQFGATWLLARGLFVEPAIAVRIGGERPDMTFSLNLPWTF